MTNVHQTGSDQIPADFLYAVTKTTGGPVGALIKLFGFQDSPYKPGYTSSQKKADKMVGGNRVILTSAPELKDGYVEAPAYRISLEDLTRKRAILVGGMISMKTPRIELIPVKGRENMVDVFAETYDYGPKNARVYFGSVDVNSPPYNQTVAFFTGLKMPVESKFKLEFASKFHKLAGPT